MNILVACEFSARVRDAFRARGHDAWSVDLQPTMGDPTWHVQDDVRQWIGPIRRMLGIDMVIAFPPCTDLASSGARHFPAKRADGRQQRAIDLFMSLVQCGAPRVAVENPVGIMSTVYRKPDQIVQPYWFGEPWRKTTCLWLTNLPPLTPTNLVDHCGRMDGWNGTFGPERQRLREITYQGLANAMADQWA